MQIISYAALPTVLVTVSVFLFGNGNLFQSFVDGAFDGMKNCARLLPTLLLVMCAVDALFSSGAVDIICNALKPVLVFLGVPEEILPAIILRPFSGSAVTATADKMFAFYGPDSAVSKTACILMGSTDTIIYTLSVYFSSCNIKKTRYAILASFIVFFISLAVCTVLGNIMM